MDIKPALVKELRERTGAGMMECKKALVETKGDIDAAAEFLRKAGAARVWIATVARVSKLEATTLNSHLITSAEVAASAGT